MIAARLLAASLSLFLVAARADARVLVHVARAGDTPETLAAEYYGNRTLALFILEANGLGATGDRGRALRPGQKVRIPTAFHYRLKRGESLEAVAGRFLADKRRAPFLAQWSGLPKGEKPKDGADILVPFQFLHRAAAPESLAAIAKSFYGDAGEAKLLQAYNFRANQQLAAGERIVVPISHVRVRAVRLDPAPAPRVAPAVKAPHPAEAEKREAELAARVAARLAQAEEAYKDGNYNDVPAALTKLLSDEDPSEAQLVAIHRLLAFAYVALGTDELAVREFHEVLERDPEAKLDAALVSPKIRAAFDRARNSGERRAREARTP